MAPMMTAVELVFRPTEATMMAQKMLKADSTIIYVESASAYNLSCHFLGLTPFCFSKIFLFTFPL